MKNKKISVLKTAFICTLSAMCMFSCGEKKESSSEAENVINVTVGEYYLDGNKDNRCINVIDDSTLQFTNCDIEAFVDEIAEGPREFYSDETCEQIIKEMNENLSAPINYNEVDFRKNKDNEIYILLSETSGGMMCFRYISDSQGTSLVFGRKENIQEYILAE